MVVLEGYLNPEPSSESFHILFSFFLSTIRISSPYSESILSWLLLLRFFQHADILWIIRSHMSCFVFPSILYHLHLFFHIQHPSSPPHSSFRQLCVASLEAFFMDSFSSTSLLWKWNLENGPIKVIHFTRLEFLQHRKVSSSPFFFMEDCDNVFFLLEDKPCLFIFVCISLWNWKTFRKRKRRREQHSLT